MKNLKNIALAIIILSFISSCVDRADDAQSDGSDTTLVDTRRNTNTTSNFLEDTSGKVKIEDQHQNQ